MCAKKKTKKKKIFFELYLRSVGHRVKTHRITPAAVNERGDIEIKDYVILPHGEDDRLPPPVVLLSLMVPSTR